jgi:hypothetical protein
MQSGCQEVASKSPRVPLTVDMDPAFLFEVIGTLFPSQNDLYLSTMVIFKVDGGVAGGHGDDEESALVHTVFERGSLLSGIADGKAGSSPKKGRPMVPSAYRSVCSLDEAANSLKE